MATGRSTTMAVDEVKAVSAGATVSVGSDIVADALVAPL